jgi:hypothetical protein
MKQVDIAAIIASNPKAARDSSTIKAAQAAIRDRRKAGFAAKEYGLAPAIGTAKRVPLIRRGIKIKMSFGA